MKKTILLIFDIDATLLLTGGAGKISFERVFEEEFSVQNCWKDTRPDGKTDPAIIDEIALREMGRTLSAEEHQRVAAKYIAYFAQDIQESDRFRVMPGIPSLLESLSSDPIFSLGIGTGNFRGTAHEKLKKGNLLQYFSYGGYACDSRERALILDHARKRSPCQKPTAVWVIGDTPADIEAGHAINAKVLAVATGSYSTEQLSSHKPAFVQKDLSDLEAILKIFNSECSVQ